ncbi:hypothetical protein CEXT_812961, partial [Caerostris extrusa]
VRKLETEHNNERMDIALTLKEIKENRETWNIDKCSKCSCEDSQVTCWVENVHNVNILNSLKGNVALC